MNLEKIGRLIFQLRKEKNLTQKQLSELLRINSTGDGDFSCCSRKLQPLVPKTMDENHNINIEEVENDYYIEINHEMTKDHYISFVAYVTYDRVLLIKLYPEQSPTVRFPRVSGKFERGKFYMYCNQHGL